MPKASRYVYNFHFFEISVLLYLGKRNTLQKEVNEHD